MQISVVSFTTICITLSLLACLYIKMCNPNRWKFDMKFKCGFFSVQWKQFCC